MDHVGYGEQGGATQELFGVFQPEGLCWNVDNGVTELPCPTGQLDSSFERWLEGQGLEPQWNFRVTDGGEAGWTGQDHSGETDGGITENEHAALSTDLRAELQDRFPDKASLALSYTFTREDTRAFRDYRALSFPFYFGELRCAETVPKEEDLGSLGGGLAGGSTDPAEGSPPAKRRKGQEEGFGVRIRWTEAQCEAFEEEAFGGGLHRFRGE